MQINLAPRADAYIAIGRIVFSRRTRARRLAERVGYFHERSGARAGWAQAHGLRGDTSIEARARVDNAYADSWSLWLDIVVIARTAVHLVRH